MASKISSGDLISERYGSALYDLASEKKCIDSILNDFEVADHHLFIKCLLMFLEAGACCEFRSNRSKTYSHKV